MTFSASFSPCMTAQVQHTPHKPLGMGNWDEDTTSLCPDEVVEKPNQICSRGGESGGCTFACPRGYVATGTTTEYLCDTVTGSWGTGGSLTCESKLCGFDHLCFAAISA